MKSTLVFKLNLPAKRLFYPCISAFAPIKVNREFSFLFVGFSFNFGSGPKHLFAFQTWDSLHISISVLTYIFLSSCLCFSTRLSSQNLSFELFSQLSVSAIYCLFFLGFKIWVFNSQFLTRPDILFCRFPNFKHKKGYFMFYFDRPFNQMKFHIWCTVQQGMN